MCSLAVQSTRTHARSGGGSRAHSSDASTWAGAQLSLPAPSSGRCLLRGTCAGGCRRVPSGHCPQRAWVLSLDLICQPDGRGRGSSSSLQGLGCDDTSGWPDAREPSWIVRNRTSMMAFFFFRRNGSNILPLFSLPLRNIWRMCYSSGAPSRGKHLRFLLPPDSAAHRAGPPAPPHELVPPRRAWQQQGRLPCVLSASSGAT